MLPSAEVSYALSLKLSSIYGTFTVTDTETDKLACVELCGGVFKVHRDTNAIKCCSYSMVVRVCESHFTLLNVIDKCLH